MWLSEQSGHQDLESKNSTTPALTTSWVCSTVIQSFYSSKIYLNSQLVSSLPPVEILSNFMLDSQYLFQYLQCLQLAHQCSMHCPLNKAIIIKYCYYYYYYNISRDFGFPPSAKTKTLLISSLFWNKTITSIM